MRVQPQSVCLPRMKSCLPPSLGNVPRFPETIREREIRGICSAVSDGGGGGDHSRVCGGVSRTTVYNASRILHIATMPFFLSAALSKL